MFNSQKGLTATEYALVLGVVSLTLVAGFETFVTAFTEEGTTQAQIDAALADETVPDLDGDGVISMEERVAAYPDLDRNGDGVLDSSDVVAPGVFPALVSKLSGIAGNI